MHLSFFGNLIYCTVFTLLYFTLLHFSYHTLPYRTILYFKKCVIYLHCSDHYHCKWMTAILIYFTAPNTACPRNGDSSTLHMSYDTESAPNDTVTEHNTTQHNTKWRNDEAYSSSAWRNVTQRDATWQPPTIHFLYFIRESTFPFLSSPFLSFLFYSFLSFLLPGWRRWGVSRCAVRLQRKGKTTRANTVVSIVEWK